MKPPSPPVFDPPTPASPLRIYRVARGYTQRQLAARAGVTQHTIANLERRKYSPQAFTATRIAEVLEVSVSALFPKGTSTKAGIRHTPTIGERRSEWNGDLSDETDPDTEVMVRLEKDGFIWGSSPTPIDD